MMSGPPARPLILGLETSCDETAAAVVGAGTQVYSNVIATQHELHRRYSGVVPEIASRAHLERILPVIREALNDAGAGFEDLDAIAVRHRPGLIGSLLVGTSAAKALAWSLGLGLIGVDHIVAHLHACYLDLDPDTPRQEALGLVVSGGHTSLLHVHGPLEVRVLGRTIDDAVGEAYDKAAVILGLDYPGGPAIDRLARQGDDQAHDLPVALLGRDSLDFSFSGLKTALLYAVRGTPKGPGNQFERDAGDLTDAQRADFAASFQRAAVTALVAKLQRALDRVAVGTLLVGGGVSANSLLRARVETLARERGLVLRLPAPEYCMDNAAMIAGLAAARYAAGSFDDWTLSASTRSAVRKGWVVT